MLDPIRWALVILDITESQGEQMSALALGGEIFAWHDRHRTQSGWK
jgi:hypothetical protein